MIEPMGGTDEAVWSARAAAMRFPPLDVMELAERSVLVIAAHPDDETLAVGGLLALLAAFRAQVRFVWASDGEASHSRASTSIRAAIPAVRRAEADAALATLGLGEAPRTRLGLPDSKLADREDELARRLAVLADPNDVILAPWSGDGHPDHEACGRAARRLNKVVVEYPVWAWHWATPEDPRIPWERARRIDLSPAVLRHKYDALSCFQSQTEPLGGDSDEAPVLPERVLAHFRRTYEVVLT